MSESERARVGQALELLRDALIPYVDAAMVDAYGQEWDDVIAEDDAKWLSRRKRSVSKKDLVVMLKAIVHRPIDPWSSEENYPRIRAFASELLSLRHLHHHGDDCIGEHARLLDTASRLLGMLGEPVPGDLEPKSMSVPAGVAPVAERSQPPASLFDAEVARLGEPGVQLVEIYVRASQLSTEVSRQAKEAWQVLDPENPDFDAFTNSLQGTVESTGAEVVELLAKTYKQQADWAESEEDVLGVLRLFVRCELLGPSWLGVCASAYAISLARNFAEEIREIANEFPEQVKVALDGGLEVPDLPEFGPTKSRLDEVTQMLEQESSHEERVREMIRRASLLEEVHPIPNLVIASGSLQLATALKESGPDDSWNGEGLSLVRDAIARLRLDAGMQPGSETETLLVVALRQEGEICNDLGLPDEAIQAFARADEIVDRYPTADPALRQN